MSHFVAKRHTTSKITLSWLTFGRRTKELSYSIEESLKLKTANSAIFCGFDHVMWVPVTTAWRVLGLRMEETASSCREFLEYIE
jgi:hypothetical protein